MITFNKPPYTGKEDIYILDAIKNQKISGDGMYSKKCHSWFENKLRCHKVLLTPSCTAALEMAALLIGISDGDEVIMPSYTFVSTANAFVLRGAKIVFVDIDPKTMNIDHNKIEEAITNKTKAIVPVHYAGVACEMDTIMNIAERHNLIVIEDAAQGMMSSYKGKPLGTIGHLGTYSFHETKNYTSAGEGGLLIINDSRFKEASEIIREKGTNRSQFFRGMIDKYTWVGIGSSYLPNDVSAAFLWGQLEMADEINTYRMKIWDKYYNRLQHLEDKGLIKLPTIPTECVHNAHMFYLKTKDIHKRAALIEYLGSNNINAVFHYIPLHSAPAGIAFSRFHGNDEFTTVESERLLRLPLFYGLKDDQVEKVICTIERYFSI